MPGRFRWLTARKRLIERLTALWNYERYQVLFEEGGLYFYRKNDGLQNQDVLYVIDLRRPDPKDWNPIVPEAAEPLEQASYVGGMTFVSSHDKNAHSGPCPGRRYLSAASSETARWAWSIATFV